MRGLKVVAQPLQVSLDGRKRLLHMVTKHGQLLQPSGFHVAVAEDVDARRRQAVSSRANASRAEVSSAISSWCMRR